MRVVIFGSTGKTGKHLVQQALDEGHEVVAFARTLSKLEIKHPKLEIVQGDVQNAADVEKAIKGVDAVVSVLGPASNKPEFAITKGMKNIISAMQKQQIKRLIISAGAGVRDPKDKVGLIDRIAGAVLHLVSKNVVADMKQVVELVRESNLDWTIVRVPMLTDQPPQGSLKQGYLGDTGIRISRADMAAFMLDQLRGNQYMRQAPVISN